MVINLWKLSFFILLLGVAIYMQIFASSNFKTKDAQLIMFIQQYNELEGTFNVLEFLGREDVKIYLIAVIYSGFTPYKAFIYVVVLSISTLLSMIFNAIFQDDRPWTSPFVKTSICDYSYGFPVDNTFISIPTFLVALQIFWGRSKFNMSNQELIFKIISVILLFTFIFSLGLSEVYFGSHFFYQVGVSFIFGLAVYVFLVFVLNFNVDNAMDLHKLLSESTYNLQFSIVYLLLYVVFLVCILIVGNSWSDKSSSTIGSFLLFMKCNKNNQGQNPMTKTLLSSSVYFLTLSSFLGIIINYKVFFDRNLESYVSSLDDNENDNGLENERQAMDLHNTNHKEGVSVNWVIARLIRVMIALALFYVLINFVYLFGIDYEESGLILSFLLEKLLPTMLLGLILFGCINRVNEHVDKLLGIDVN